MACEGRVTVYVALDEYWETTEVTGVYASMEAAQAEEAPGPRQEWLIASDGAAYMKGLNYGHARTITPYEMKGA